MICRVWHGWTSQANADGYERFCARKYSAGSPVARSPVITASNCIGEQQATKWSL
jgi:hypothetical protein